MSHDQVLRHVPQWREFIGWKLYPQKHVTFPEFEGMRDGLICDVTCQHTTFGGSVASLGSAQAADERRPGGKN